MTKYRILIEAVTYGYDDPPDRKHTYGTDVTYQLIEFDAKDEAELAIRAIPNVGIGGLYVRTVFKLYA